MRTFKACWSGRSGGLKSPSTLGWASFILCGLVVIGNLAAASSPPEEYGRVELIRDSWGVPNIFSETDEGALYGLGYAAAEDRLYQMNFNLRLMQGRLAEAAGDLGKRNQRPGRINSALEQDRLMRTLGYHRHAEKVVAELDPDARRLLEAYCEGVNDYVDSHSDDLHPLFEKQGWAPEPWTPADCLVSWWHIAQFFSADGLRDLFSEHQKERPRRLGERSRARVDDEAAVVRREDVTQEWIDETMEFMRRHGLDPSAPDGKDEEGPKFSHAWVVGGRLTDSGAAILVSDPQTPVWNPSLFQEFHIAGKTFNARGIGVAGSPLILIGYNEDVAWGMTALGADQADLFRLEIDPERPNYYRLDGEWKPMVERTETLKTNGGGETTLRVRETVFGPVVSEFALDRRAGEEVALKRIPLAETDRDTIEAAFAMIRAGDAEEFGRALEGWRFPSANCVFGDRDGAIGYWTVGAIPVRASAERGPTELQDGTSRAADWQTYVPHRLLPHVIDPKRGYLVTANHRSIQSFYRLTLGASTGSAGDTDRGWRIKQRIQERLAAGEPFTPESVLDIQDDKVNAVKRAIVRLGYRLRETRRDALSDQALASLRHLEAWNRKGGASDMSTPGTELVNLMSTFFRETATPLAGVYGGGGSGLVLAMKTLTRRFEEDPYASFTEEEIEFIDGALAGAWESAERSYGQDPRRWHERARRQAQQAVLGYMESLDGYPSLDPRWDIERPLLEVYDGSTILAQPGQSYTQFVPLHDPDQAQTILPIGQSERPDSPFRFSNLGDWAAGRLHPAPLSKGAVEALAFRRQVLSKSDSPARALPAARGGSRGGDRSARPPERPRGRE